MKYSQLSNFQKQQYTSYLETQLQKFSAFMLAQKRENDKYRLLEDAIAYQSNIINQMEGKVDLMELYQKQNHGSFEHLSKKISKIQDVQTRIRRLEDRQRFGCDDHNNKKHITNKEKLHNSSESEEQVSRLEGIEKNYRECMKVIKKQQIELTDCQDALDKIRRNKNIENTVNHTNPEIIIDKKDLKRLQKKLVRYFNDKIEEVESTIHRRRSKSSKSRSGRTGQLSIIDNYTIKQPKNVITSFRMEDEITNKSQMSTILQSKSTKNSKNSEKDLKYIKKKRDPSKSRSKSKNKSVSKSKSKCQKDRKNRSKSKSRSKNHVNKSFSISDESMIHSSKSRSKSHISKHNKSKSKDSMLSKHSKHSKKTKKSQSKEKPLSNSHDLCKKRPQLGQNLPKKTPQVKRETLPLRKRKPVQLQRYK